MLNNYKLKYSAIIVTIIAGYFFLFNYSSTIVQPNNPTLCIFKNVTGVPCPSCGSTRATVHLLQGHFWDSILLNPLALVANILIVLSTFWMLIDIKNNKETFFPFLKKDWAMGIKIVLLIIILSNWAWNIEKGL